MLGDFSSLPSMDRLLGEKTTLHYIHQYGRKNVIMSLREILQNERKNIAKGQNGIKPCHVTEKLLVALQKLQKLSLMPVYNLTGIILHTNLGRALLPDEAILAATKAMQHAVTLEYDMHSGKRGERDDHLREKICQLTGAEDATFVNNNAAALFLVLNSLAKNSKNAIISRGELVEIGGSFRIPDIIISAGCCLKEVGTTNRTHYYDYENAIDENTALILKVHSSNYRVEGFTKSVSLKELSPLAIKNAIPLVEDMGSGNLIDLKPYGLENEPTVQNSIKSGVDLVTFSGDKLLGGPQIGVILGKKKWIAVLNKNPIKRCLRVDKMRIAAMEALLQLYSHEELRDIKIPTLRYLAKTPQEIAKMAENLCPKMADFLAPNYQVQIIACHSEVGSGASPLQKIKSYGLAIKTLDKHNALEDLAQKMRQLPIPVIGRITDNRFILDVRCLDNLEDFCQNLQHFQP